MNGFSRLLTLGLAVGSLALAAFGGAGGCNADEIAGQGDDDNVVAVEQDAKDAAAAAENVAFRSFTAAFGSPGTALSTEASGLILSRLKNAITAESISLCSEEEVPSPSGSDVTINGSVGGSCAVKFEGDSSDGILRANCTNYDDGADSGEAEVDGLVGVRGGAATVGDESTFQFDAITSDLLVLTLADGDNCSATFNMSASVTINNVTSSGSVNVDGCVRICGESFSVSGSETF